MHVDNTARNRSARALRDRSM